MKSSKCYQGSMPSALLVCVFACISALAQQPPPTPKRPVKDLYHHVTVVDDYRWLENFTDPEVKQWVAAENAYTRSLLDKLPGRAALAHEVDATIKNLPTNYYGLRVIADKVFAFKAEPTREQPELVVFPALTARSPEKIVLDPLKIDAQGHVAMDFYQPSLDGRYVAVSLSRLGSEAGDVHVFEVGTGKELFNDIVPRVNNGTAGGSVAWNADGMGFFYTRYPRAGERSPADLGFYQQIYFHKLGIPVANDRYEAGKDFPRIAEIALQASDDGKWILATVANGDGGDFFHLVRGTDGNWRQLTHYSDQISQVRFGVDNSLYLLSRQNAPMGKLLRLTESASSLGAAKLVTPESDVAIEDFTPTSDRLFVVDMAGGPSQIRMFTNDGKFLGKVPIEGIVAVNGIERIGRDDVLFRTSGYTQAPEWFRYSPATQKANLIPVLSPHFSLSFADAEVVRDFAVSKDGTHVPLNIIRLKSTHLNGKNPVLLTGYGGYRISETPGLNPLNRVLLDHGFVIVTTNLRGGGEFGEKWHEAGKLTHKQNVFDDFYACAQYLVSNKYTTPERLSIIGGSNGGLLMGAELVQHPEMYRAVVAFVGIYDMLRVELSPNGAFNVTEFGTVKELDQFKALYAYSPYHHVSDSKSYPAAIFLTGDNDPRVDPANSRKMVARLQAVGHSKGPILLRTTSNAGHGIGSSLSEQVAQVTDAFSFLFDQLGIK
jgi:prolyl oligopeptidase